MATKTKHSKAALQTAWIQPRQRPHVQSNIESVFEPRSRPLSHSNAVFRPQKRFQENLHTNLREDFQANLRGDVQTNLRGGGDSVSRQAALAATTAASKSQFSSQDASSFGAPNINASKTSTVINDNPQFDDILDTNSSRNAIALGIMRGLALGALLILAVVIARAVQVKK